MAEAAAVDPVRHSKCLAACNNCKRRKERCNSAQPCMRCVFRGVAASCSFSVLKPHAKVKKTLTRTPRGLGKAHRAGTLANDLALVQEKRAGHTPGQAQETILPQISNVTRGASGSVLTAGNNPSSGFVKLCGIDNKAPVLVCHPSGVALLHNVRRVVQNCLGKCEFLLDPPGHDQYTVVSKPLRQSTHWQSQDTHIRPLLPEARYYIRRFLLATSWWLDIDTTDLLQRLPDWLESPSSDGNTHDAIYYLVFAIGAQTCPEDCDDLAQSYFNLARHMVARLSTDEPSIASIQSYCLLSMYLLGDYRVNAAFTHLGMAVRAAYVLGLHCEEFSAQLSPAEYQLRERVWKSLRFLDTFLSASLGHPPSTRETRDTDSMAHSPALGICHIFEKIMSNVYTRASTYAEALDMISKKQRLWAARLTDTLVLDSVQDSSHIAGSEQLNISLLHVKQSFYCSIILLTWPSFFESVEESIRRTKKCQAQQHGIEVPPAETKGEFCTYACIDSAMRMIDVLAPLEEDLTAPKRLPIIMNSAFVAALVVGAALFARFDKAYPLARAMSKVIALFRRFSSDPLASRFGDIVELLNEAWKEYQSRQAESQKELHNRLISNTFGTLIHVTDGSGDSASQTFGRSNIDDNCFQGVSESDTFSWDMWSRSPETGTDPMQDQLAADSNPMATSNPTLLPDHLLDYDFDWTTFTSTLTELDSSWSC